VGSGTLFCSCSLLVFVTVPTDTRPIPRSRGKCVHPIPTFHGVFTSACPGTMASDSRLGLLRARGVHKLELKLMQETEKVNMHLHGQFYFSYQAQPPNSGRLQFFGLCVSSSLSFQVFASRTCSGSSRSKERTHGHSSWIVGFGSSAPSREWRCGRRPLLPSSLSAPPAGAR
jgi:hypothetical protein